MIRSVSSVPAQVPNPAPVVSAPAPAGPVDAVQIGGVAPSQTPAPPAPPTPLRKAFDALVNMGGPGKVRLLENNEQSWNARWRMLEGATKTLDMQYFTWDHDAFGLALMGHVFKKAREGVKARLMVDCTGDTFGTRGFKSHIGGKDYLQELLTTGKVEARIYHPHWKKVIDQLLAIGSTAIAASNHDKIIVADGVRGLTGGRNIGYEYYAHPDDFAGAWRDTDVAFEGHAAADSLKTAFEVEYGAPWITSPVRGEIFGNWRKRDIELLGAYAMMDSWIKDKPLDAAAKQRLRSSEEAREAEAQALVQKAVRRLPAEGIDRTPSNRELKALGKLAAELVKYPEMRGTYNAPQPREHEGEIKILDKTSSVGIGRNQINTALLAMCKAAQKRIVIENPYVVLTKDMIEALQEAGKRGVEIWLGTNSPSSTDSAVTQAFFLNDWPKLEATIPNLKIFVATGERKLHAKVAVADDTLTLVSTYNLDFLSQDVNSEVASLIWSPDFAKETYQGILRDHADTKNGAVEYQILRDAAGKPIRSDGKPVLDANGELLHEPEIVFGPDHHVPADQMAKYRKKMSRWNWLRKVIPQLQPLETLKVKIRDED